MDELFKIISTYENKKLLAENGVCGLQNMGNTCYLNSVIQCIRHNAYLFEYLKESYFMRHINEKLPANKTFILAWRQLILDFWTHNHQVIQPVGFFPTFQQLCISRNKAELIGYNQNDAEVFLQFFLENIHDSMKLILPSSRVSIKGEIKTPVDKLMQDYCKYYEKHINKNGISPITSEYEGIHCSSITNNIDNKISNSFEPFTYINLSISDLDENDSIMKSLDLYTQPEILEGYRDDEKKYPDDAIFKRAFRFVNLPNNLIIILKRFSFNMNTGRPSKVKTTINFPTKLDMSSYCVGYVSKERKYELYAICNHKGGLNSGHYYSFVKGFDDKWVLYNDDSFKNIPEDIMDKKKLFSQDAYILFYRKSNF